MNRITIHATVLFIMRVPSRFSLFHSNNTMATIVYILIGIAFADSPIRSPFEIKYEIDKSRVFMTSVFLCFFWCSPENQCECYFMNSTCTFVTQWTDNFWHSILPSLPLPNIQFLKKLKEINIFFTRKYVFQFWVSFCEQRFSLQSFFLVYR